jgi:hypothetical protein
LAKILILGGGFGGVVAAERLANELGEEHQITLVSRSRRFVFYPALVRLAFGKCELEDVSFDLRQTMLSRRVNFIEVEVGAYQPSRSESESTHQIEFLPDFPIERVASGAALTSNGHAINSDLLMLVPPFQGASAASYLGITKRESYVYLHKDLWGDEAATVGQGRFWGWAKHLQEYSWEVSHS